MTPEQAAAYVNSQVACMMATLAAMHEENRERELQGHTHAHDHAAFLDLPNNFGVHHNAVCDIFADANS